MQFALIGDQPNAFISIICFIYVCINFVCVKECTTYYLCIKLGNNRLSFLKYDGPLFT